MNPEDFVRNKSAQFSGSSKSIPHGHRASTRDNLRRMKIFHQFQPSEHFTPANSGFMPLLEDVLVILPFCLRDMDIGRLPFLESVFETIQYRRHLRDLFEQQ